MTQFCIWLIEYCWVLGLFLTSIIITCIFSVIAILTSQKLKKNEGSNWISPWWDVWNFYYANLFNNLNRATRVFFQISWNEWHVLDIRIFFLIMSTMFVFFA